MRVAAVIGDLMLYSRIESAARIAGAKLSRIDSPTDIPPDAELVLIDWSARESGWATEIAAWRGRSQDARVILIGPHTDLEAHAAARDAGLGPMWARSKVVFELARLISPRTEGSLRSIEARGEVAAPDATSAAGESGVVGVRAAQEETCDRI